MRNHECNAPKVLFQAITRSKRRKFTLDAQKDKNGTALLFSSTDHASAMIRD